MKRIASGLVAAAAIVALTGPALAQPSMDFHMSFPTFNCGALGTTVTDCGSINPNFSAGMTQAMIVLGGVTTADGQLGGAGAVQFGIDYSTSPGTVIAVASNCSTAYLTASIPGQGGQDWPASGSGAAVAFGSCIDPIGPSALIGVQYLFFANITASGVMQIIPDPAEGDIKYVDCSDVTVDIDPTNVGMVDFSGGMNIAACDGPVPTEEHSWGEIKALF